MELIKSLVDVVLHLDRHLAELTANYGTWTYLILFLIVFCETGLVVTPFLPGDSLLFAAGAIAALGSLDVRLLMALLIVAALIGDNLNYWIGRYIGPRAFTAESRWLKRKHLIRTQEFYARHGGKTVVMARFIPIVRTFAPFVAGIGSMSYRRFLTYSVLGAILWVGLFVPAGYFFGNVPAVKQNFTLVILAIIGISVLPILLEYLRSRKRGTAAA